MPSRRLRLFMLFVVSHMVMGCGKRYADALYDTGEGVIVEFKRNSSGKMDAISLKINARTDADDKIERYLTQHPSVKFIDLQGSNVSEKGLERIGHHQMTEILVLSDKNITDIGVAHLTNLKNLKSLDLMHTSVTNDGLRKLSVLRQLRILGLSGSQFNDDSLALLKDMTEIRILIIIDTNITNAGLVHLKDLPKLRRLYGPRGVTRQGVKDALPNVEYPNDLNPFIVVDRPTIIGES